MENNKEEKIFGIYPATLKLDVLEQCAEYEVWTYIERFGGYIWRMNHDMADGRIEVRDADLKDLEERQYELEYLVYYTKKFGVEFNREPEAGKHVERSESYNKWYQFWSNHFNNMSDEEMKEMNIAIQNGLDLTKFLPKTRWNGEPLTSTDGANV